MTIKKLENQDAVFEIKNGILIGSFKNAVIELKDAVKITNDRNSLQERKHFPILSNIKNVKTVTKEARDFLASEAGCEGVIAAAVIIDSSIGSMIGNFFIRISKPLRPTKIFTEEKDAIVWLEQFIK